MKTNIVMSARLLFIAFVFILTGCNSKNEQPDISDTDHIIVLVTYKTQPTKELEAVLELTKLIEKVKKEPHFINIKLHIDPKDGSNILLYEEWDDESYYNTDHMKTTHLQKFITDSRNFLSGPPEISFWKIESDFKQ
ncbi:putative quinol monooxygenase [Flavobacteriaceae bacterium LMO-SS05]